MEKSKLFLTLSSLDLKERKRFSEYVHSPFFNKNEKVQQLCEIMLKAMDQPKKKPLLKTRVFKKIFKEDHYKEIKLNNVISDLLQLLQDFLGFVRFREDRILQQNLVARELISREQYQNFNTVTRRYDQLRAQSEVKNYHFYLSEYEYYEVLDLLSLSGDKRSYNKALQSKSDMLDLYYFANKLRIACDMYSRNIVINAGYEPHFVEDMLDRYEEKFEYYGDILALKLYYVTLKMLREGEEQHYFGLKDFLEENNRIFPPEELNTVYSYALNYCVRKINSGQTHFYAEILSLYKVLLQKELLFSNGYLSQWDYTNIITSAMRLNEFDWADEFIHQYKTSLLPDEQFNVYTYNLTALHFARKDYDKALQLLHEVEFTDPFYHAAAKIIQLKVYFEMQQTEAFFSLAEAFKQFVNRNRQFSGYQKKSNLNFIRAALWLYKDRLKGEVYKNLDMSELYQTTRSKIQHLDPLANKAWLDHISENQG
ncbi:MAG: hypothetical protein KDC85_16505 [Saprospiraceae bacterium]|nr:hypothetical protein [Saprospiraceae bacterium]MCB9322181.1 hypothetical protein [Lewinellaceae bacterium]